MELKLAKTLKSGVVPLACAAFLAACGGGGGASGPGSATSTTIPAGTTSSDSTDTSDTADTSSVGSVDGTAEADATVSYEALLGELDDGRTAVQVLPAPAYVTAVVLPVAAVEQEGVDNHELLRRLFERVTGPATGDEARVEAWVVYLQDRIAHPDAAPLTDDGIAVFDPYWLLEHRIAHCGQTNRLIVDGLLAAGFQARVVQWDNHVGAEVFLAGSWHYLDADLLNGGDFVRRPDGSVPSAQEIFRDPSLVAGLRVDIESRLRPPEVSHWTHPVYVPDVLELTHAPYYYVKTATPQQEHNVYYGWNYYDTVSM